MPLAGRNCVVWLVFVLLLVATSVAAAEPRTVVPGGPPVAVDPALWGAIESEGEAEFAVVLSVRADLTGAYRLPTKEAKGRYVFEALTGVAATTQAPILRQLDLLGVDYQPFWIRNMIRVWGGRDVVAQLAARPDVAYLYLERDAVLDEVTPAPAPAQGPGAIEWNILRINADKVWDQGITGEGVVVGHLDTGVEWEHPALVKSYRPPIPGAPTPHDYNWWNGIGGSQVPVDFGTHGTATLGIITGGDGEDRIGVAPGARWMACAGVQAPPADPMECLQFFLAPTRLDGSDPRPDLAPHVINNSWSHPDDDFHDVIQALHAAGIMFVKAAANEGPGCKTISNPGQWPEVTAVGAFDSDDEIAAFSSRGPAGTGIEEVIKPDIAAPGVAVRTSYPGGLYAYRDGTSMSCPHVVGGVALVLSARPELAGEVDLLQEILERTAERKVDLQCLPNGPGGVPNNVWGYGILDASAAVGVALAKGGLEGVVRDGLSQDPVPGAHIEFEDTFGWHEAGQSGTDGRYEQALLAGTYVLTTTRYGYLPAIDTGVAVPPGVTATHDVALDPAPIWQVSGAVRGSQNGDPLPATIEFQDTPVVVQTDPATGEYAAAVAQGTWWMRVSSGGHASEERLVTVDRDQAQDFLLPAIHNYFVRTSNDTCDPPVFGWLDATGGEPHCLSDDSAVLVPLPGDVGYPFYGINYNALWVGSNGHVTFGAGWDEWSGPIPDPALPNNGIYAFSTDLNPADCAQGTIYTGYLLDRFFVIQFDAVEHYPSGNPESFEIVLDTHTGRAAIQYLTVSAAAGAVVGVENADGTQATRYANAGPEPVVDGLRLEFHPVFGAPPALGPGGVQGFVLDNGTGAPVGGATVTAQGSSGEPAVWTSNPAGAYGGELCPGAYALAAAAGGYHPSGAVEVEVAAMQTTFQDFGLVPVEADLWLSKTAPYTATAGSLLTYTLSFGSSGPDAAVLVEVWDELPQDAAYLGSTGGTYSESVHAVLWTWTDVVSGDAASAELTVVLASTLMPGDTVCNGAMIEVAGGQPPRDPNPGNSSAEACTRITEPLAPAYRLYAPVLLSRASSGKSAAVETRRRERMGQPPPK